MPLVDLVDETFIVAAPAVVAARVRDPAVWRQWWPDLRLTVFQDRGDEGLRWTVTGALVGTSELWLEPMLDGTLVHYYLRADPSDPVRGDPGRAAGRLARARSIAVKQRLNALKDELESGREVGDSPSSGSPVSAPVVPPVKSRPRPAES